LVTGEGTAVTQTAGIYDAAEPGTHEVTALLAVTDFEAGSGTLLTNYALPTKATGMGTIVTNTKPVIPDIFIRAFIPLANPRYYIPYPSPYTVAYAHTNGFAPLSIVQPIQHTQSEDSETTDSGTAIFNAPEDILNAGRAGKIWQSRYPREPIYRISGISN
jgi:hypothetical protein